MARPITSWTKLGRLVKESGKPLYYWAAVAEIAYSKMSKYASGAESIPSNHLFRLAQAFGVEPEEIVGVVDETVDAG